MQLKNIGQTLHWILVPSPLVPIFLITRKEEKNPNLLPEASVWKLLLYSNAQKIRTLRINAIKHKVNLPLICGQIVLHLTMNPSWPLDLSLPKSKTYMGIKQLWFYKKMPIPQTTVLPSWIHPFHQVNKWDTQPCLRFPLWISKDLFPVSTIIVSMIVMVLFLVLNV